MWGSTQTAHASRQAGQAVHAFIRHCAPSSAGHLIQSQKPWPAAHLHIRVIARADGAHAGGLIPCVGLLGGGPRKGVGGRRHARAERWWCEVLGVVRGKATSFAYPNKAASSHDLCREWEGLELRSGIRAVQGLEELEPGIGAPHTTPALTCVEYSKSESGPPGQ